MKTILSRTAAHVRGRVGQRKHGKVVDNVFKTRDALDASANSMLAEIESNDRQINALRNRNRVLLRQVRHARTVASRIAEFFLPR